MPYSRYILMRTNRGENLSCIHCFSGNVVYDILRWNGRRKYYEYQGASFCEGDVKFARDWIKEGNNE